MLQAIWPYKKKGYGSKLLQRSIDSAKEKKMHGVVGITIEKGGWLPKKEIYLKNGFEKVDALPQNFALYAYKFSKESIDPKFHPQKPERISEYGDGFTVLTSHQCPYMENTVQSLQILADESGEELKIIEMNEFTDAQMCGLHPYGTFHVVRNGVYITHLLGGMRDIKKALG